MATSTVCSGQLLSSRSRAHFSRPCPAAFSSARPQKQAGSCRHVAPQQHRRGVRAAAGAEKGGSQGKTRTAAAGTERPGEKVEVPDELKSEADRKADEVERLRAAEKFMTKGTGEGDCQACGYSYSPKAGDDEYPVPKGTRFEDLPGDWQCPVCGAGKKTFKSKAVTVAGFAENQKYGLGSNSMTEGQKSLLIFGSLGFFFCLFLLGYLL